VLHCCVTQRCLPRVFISQCVRICLCVCVCMYVCVRVLHLGTTKKVPTTFECAWRVRACGHIFVVLESARAHIDTHAHTHNVGIFLWRQNVHTHVHARTTKCSRHLSRCAEMHAIRHHAPDAYRSCMYVCCSWASRTRCPLHSRVCVLQSGIKQKIPTTFVRVFRCMCWV
jgi:hypothetical protein